MNIYYFGELVSGTTNTNTTQTDQSLSADKGKADRPSSMTPIGEILKDLDLSRDKFRLSDPFNFAGYSHRPTRA